MIKKDHMVKMIKGVSGRTIETFNSRWTRHSREKRKLMHVEWVNVGE